MDGEHSNAAVLYGHPPVQICPSPTHPRFVEVARIVPRTRKYSFWRPPQRDVVRTSLWWAGRTVLCWVTAPIWFLRNSGRIEVLYDVDFPSTHCPHCGAVLIRYCERSEAHLIRNPSDTHCRDCSDKYWWALQGDESAEFEVLSDWSDRSEVTFTLPSKLEVAVLRYSITKLKNVAIVCAVNNRGELRGDVAQAIRFEGGVTLPEAAGTTWPLGHYWVTPAGALPASKIVFVVARPERTNATPATVRTALGKAIEGADQAKIDRLAVPAIGTGTGGLDPETVGRAYGEVLSGRAAGAGSLRSVTVVILREDHVARFVDGFESVLGSGVTLARGAGPSGAGP